MPYIHFTGEQKRLAASVDLVEFLRQRGEKLLPSGHEKRLDSDHSITVRGNAWYDHAAEKGGGPISFAQTFYHLSYPDAVTLLLGGAAAGACLPTEKQAEVEKSSSNCRLLTTLCAGSMPICSKSGTSSVTC